MVCLPFSGQGIQIPVPAYRTIKLALPNNFRRDISKVDWNAFEPRPSLLCLPAIAILLCAGILGGHPSAAMIAAGGAQTAGFGSFQKPLLFRAGPMVLASIGMAISTMVGSMAHNTVVLVALGIVWAFLYGMCNAISSPASWVGQQCCTFLVVSSAFPDTPGQAALRGVCVLFGGLLQSLTIEFFWQFTRPAKSALDTPDSHPPGWRWRAVRANLTLKSGICRYAVRLSVIAILSILIYRHLPFANAYWIPMTALIIPKPELFLTAERVVSRILGTVIGGGIATAIAALFRPQALLLALLVLIFIWAAYSLQNVNYGIYITVLTGYIAFLLAIGRLPASEVAFHRIFATFVGGAIVLAAYLIDSRLEQRLFSRRPMGRYRQRV